MKVFFFWLFRVWDIRYLEIGKIYNYRNYRHKNLTVDIICRQVIFNSNKILLFLLYSWIFSFSISTVGFCFCFYFCVKHKSEWYHLKNANLPNDPFVCRHYHGKMRNKKQNKMTRNAKKVKQLLQMSFCFF